MVALGHTRAHTHMHDRSLCFKCCILLYIIKLYWKNHVAVLRIKCSSLHLVGVRQKSSLGSSSGQPATVKCTDLTGLFPLYMPVCVERRQWRLFSSRAMNPFSPNRGIRTVAPCRAPPQKKTLPLCQNPHLLETEDAAAGRCGRQRCGDPSEGHDHEPQNWVTFVPA